MTLTSMIVDDFFSRPAALRAYAIARDYRDTAGPDGVTYPGINAEVPAAVLAEAIQKLEGLLGRAVHPTLTFFRLTTEGMAPPHLAHTDAELSQYLALIYLSAPEHCTGGTALVEHVETGMRAHPQTEDELAIWRRDTNDESKWRVVGLAGLRFNRLALYDTSLLHAALPRQGFGASAADGRLVLTIFFNTGEVA